MEMIKRLICSIIGHRFLYNFPNMPNKRICQRCYKKEKWADKPYDWNTTFQDKRTDEELINKWFHLKN